MNILVVIEHSQGSIHRLSKEAIVGAQSLGNKVTALVIGEGSEETTVSYTHLTLPTSPHV